MASTRRVPQAKVPSGIYVSRKKVVMLLSIFAAVAVGVAVWLVARGSVAERGTRALVEAYSKRRLIEPRLSGGFQAGVFNPAPNDTTDIDGAKLIEATGYIYQAVSESNDSKARQSHARMLIAGGQSNKAMLLLRPLAAERDATAEISNDFGVCLFEQGRIEDAIDQFNHALEKNPRMREALFNRALCYQKLQLRDAARADLTRLQAEERDSGWGAETKLRLDEATRPVQPPVNNGDIIAEFKAALASKDFDKARGFIRGNFTVVREYAITNLVKEYSQDLNAGDTAAASQALSMLELIGTLVAETNGDKEISDFVTFLRGLSLKELKTTLASVEDCFKQIDAIFDAREYVQSIANLGRLEKEFAAQGNEVFQVVSAWSIARVHYVFNRHSETVRILGPVATIAARHQWTYQHARIIGQMGMSKSRLGEDSIGIRHCQEALDGFRKVGTFEAKALQYLSLPYWHLGDFDTALKHLRESTNLFISKEHEPSELALNCLQAADIYRVRNRHVLSILFASQAFAYAEESNEGPFASLDSSKLLGNPYAAQASSLMAIEQARLNRYEEAEKNLETAFKYLKEIGAGRARAYNEPLVLTRAGEVAALKRDTEQALKYYQEAETLIANAQENIIPMIRVLRGRTDALIGAGRETEADANLQRALSLVENYRSKITGSDQRSYFLEGSQALFDQAISLKMKSAESYAEAFNLSERSRARALLDEIADNNQPVVAREVVGGAQSTSETGVSNRPLLLKEVQAALRENLKVLEYSVTSQGTYLFLVTRNGFEVRRSEATMERLDFLVNTYLSELRSTAKLSDSAATDYLSETAHELYRMLILPIEDQLGQNDYVCIVPDKSLHYIPFAALLDRQNRYLLESYNLSYAPSASVLARCIREKARQTGPEAERIFAVGNPSFDKKAFPELKDLPDSYKEAVEAADLYDPSSRMVLTGPAATKQRVIEGLKDCDVAHLASHCLVKDDSPWRAALVLAAGIDSASATPVAQADSLLSLNEIYRAKFPRIKLAILSACETGLGQYYRGEGIVSLVRPFIASDVQTVVASLWQVDSRATRELMVAFHKERKSRPGRTGEALRAAQRKMAGNGPYQHPYYWASFIVIGNSN